MHAACCHCQVTEKVRNHVLIVERGLHEPMQRDHPVLAKNGYVLNDLAVDAIEAVGIVLIGVAVVRDLVEAAAPRVAG